MSWDFEEILELNPRAPDQTRSPIERLLDVGAASPSILCFAAEALDARGGDHVAVLFQLPFSVTVEDEWIRLPTSPDSGFADVALRRMCLNVDDFGRTKLLDVASSGEAAGAEGIPICQGLAVFRVWGKRQRFHPRYVAAVERNRRDEIVVPQRDSWVDNRPMTAAGYAESLSTRLRREVSDMLARFLPAYSLLSRTEAPTPHRIYGFATMLSPGRLSKVGSAIPLIKHFLPQGDAGVDRPVAWPELQSTLRGPPRELGRFEAQLFAMDRLRREGETALSIVGTAALLEWLLVSHLGLPRGKDSLNDILKGPARDVLPQHLVDVAEEVRTTRNRLVHGAPPLRRMARRIGELSLAGREMGGDERFAPDQSRAFIEGAFEIFRVLNQRNVGTASAK